MIFYLRIIAFIWIFGVLGLWTYVYSKGRAIVRYVRQRYPERWGNLGKPQPYFLIANQPWSLFLSNETYKDFEDRKLTDACERQRRLENLTLLLAILFFVVFGGIALWYRFIG